MELDAAFLDRIPYQLIKERRAIPFGAVGLADDKVVNIEKLPPREAFGDAIAGHGHDFSFDLKKCQKVTPRHLAFDLLEESGIRQMWAQLAHDRRATLNVSVGFGNGNLAAY